MALTDKTKALLTELADHIEANVTRDKFSMSVWIANTAKVLNGANRVASVLNGRTLEAIAKMTGDEMACGTAGCAIGHAEFLPSWREAGLRFTMWGSPAFAPNTPVGTLVDHNILGGPYNSYEHTDFPGVGELLTLDRGQTAFLFDPRCYLKNKRRDPKYVAHRIREFVATDGRYSSKTYH